MADRAYSIEINKEITARKASKLSQERDLLDSKNFYCNDFKLVPINLTCTNWNCRRKKCYFTLSLKDGLYIVDCTQISVGEAKEQSKRESAGAKEIIRKNGVIKITKLFNKVRTMIKSMDTEIAINASNLSSNLNIGKKQRKNIDICI